MPACPPCPSSVASDHSGESDHASLGSPAHAGRFHVVRQQCGQPIAVAGWRVTSPHRKVAEELVSLLHGTQHECVVDGQQRTEVLTSLEAVPVLLRAGDISKRLVLRSVRESFHVCDGRVFVEPEGRKGQRCGCAPNWEKRRAAARAGRGPRPDVDIRFRLAGAPELGTFTLKSTSWDFIQSLPTINDGLRGGKSVVPFSLGLRRVDFTTASGADVSYRRPHLAPLDHSY
ncbi:recombination directionality factor [Streptomyces sp. NBC_00366]|uniref:recombination directionality factor n=1 Tax=Streptomyces sp. NBC_00366 TaxID=2975727 RepID=UPI003FA7CE70